MKRFTVDVKTSPTEIFAAETDNVFSAYNMSMMSVQIIHTAGGTINSNIFTCGLDENNLDKLAPLPNGVISRADLAAINALAPSTTSSQLFRIYCGDFAFLSWKMSATANCTVEVIIYGVEIDNIPPTFTAADQLDTVAGGGGTGGNVSVVNSTSSDEWLIDSNGRGPVTLITPDASAVTLLNSVGSGPSAPIDMTKKRSVQIAVQYTVSAIGGTPGQIALQWRTPATNWDDDDLYTLDTETAIGTYNETWLVADAGFEIRVNQTDLAAGNVNTILVEAVVLEK